jgi:hypothetical protein
MSKFLIFALIKVFLCKYPIAIFHGMGDACLMPGMSNFTKKIGNDTKSKSKCFESGASFLSVFGRSFKK